MRTERHNYFFNGGPLYVDPSNPNWDPTHPERNRLAARMVQLTNEIRDGVVGESAVGGISTEPIIIAANGRTSLTVCSRAISRSDRQLSSTNCETLAFIPPLQRRHTTSTADRYAPGFDLG